VAPLIKAASSAPISALSLSCPASMTGMAPTAPTVDCILSNTGAAAASAITYTLSSTITAAGPSTCAAKSVCGTVTVTGPSTTGNYNTTLNLSTTNGSAATASIGFVIGASTTIVKSTPASLTFGTIGRGTETGNSITLLNTGTIPATNLSVVLKQTGGSDIGTFSGSTTCGSTLEVGDSCTFDLSYKGACTNTTTGPATGTITTSGSNFPSAVTTLSASTNTVGSCS